MSLLQFRLNTAVHHIQQPLNLENLHAVTTTTCAHAVLCCVLAAQERGVDLDVVLLVQGETMVYSLRQHYHVASTAVNADPAVVKIPHVKVACSATATRITR